MPMSWGLPVPLATLAAAHRARDADEVMRELRDRVRRVDIHVRRAVDEVERSRYRCPPPIDDSTDAGC
jgi:hypothetical protein